MKLRLMICRLLPFCIALVVAGCAGSYDQAEKSSAPPTPAPPSKEAVSTPPRPDTVSVSVQKAQKPPYETTDPVKTALPADAPTKYFVQIGAYKQQENADVVASRAKSRFAREIYTIHDAGADLFKVMQGDFPTKDDARSFRDRMVQQYPGDYKDAWVSELPQ